MASLREWLDAAIIPSEDDLEGASFLLPPCNSFLRRALYESIQAEYPNLVLETTIATTQQPPPAVANDLGLVPPPVPTAATQQHPQIRVWRLNAEEKRRRQERLVREGWERLLLEKVGMYRIFLALSLACQGNQQPITRDQHILLSPHAPLVMTEKEATMVYPPSNQKQRPIPLVVHNGLQDLLFLMTHFHSPTLPGPWKDCKQLLHSYFPVIYDTKIMALEYSSRQQYATNANNNASRFPPTHLGALYERTVLHQPQWNTAFLDQPQVRDPADHDLLTLTNAAHEASYDAYMTGTIFCALSYMIQDVVHYPSVPEQDNVSNIFALWDCPLDDANIAWYYGRNQLYCHQSPFTIDLESPLSSDPLQKHMSLESTYRVSNMDPTVTTRDIVRCLSGLIDQQGRRVNFEIIWVDDTTVLVAATLRHPPPSVSALATDSQAIFHDQGKAIHQALKHRFHSQPQACPVNDEQQQHQKETTNKVVIESLLEIQHSQQAAERTAEDTKESMPASFWNLWGWFSFLTQANHKKREIKDGEDDGGYSEEVDRANKRPRLR